VVLTLVDFVDARYEGVVVGQGNVLPARLAPSDHGALDRSHWLDQERLPAGEQKPQSLHFPGFDAEFISKPSTQTP